MTFATRTTCRACDSSDLKIVLSLPDQPLANELPESPLPGGQNHFPSYLVQCQECEHVQLPIVVDPKRLFGEYRYVSGTSPVFRAHLEEQAETLSAMFGTGKVIEIGSNDGTLLAAFRKRGWKALGVDPAASLAFGATSEGNPTIPGFFTGNLADQLIALMDTPPKLVVANNVFAHADDLLGIAKGVAKLIGERGVFCFEVAYLPEVLEKNAFDTCYHEHVSHWHVKPLKRLLRRAGLNIYRVDPIAAQGGSIRCFASARGIEVPDDHADCSGWPARIAVEKATTLEKIAPWLGKGLAIYGCPARLTPWAYTMSLRANDVDCVFDDNPHKIGRVTPGLFWPIVSSDELMKRNPPAILVASWNYIGEIRSRFPEYRGEWVAMR